MSLSSYMQSPVGFGAYGEEYLPEVVELTEEDLAPLDPKQSASWVTPSQFSGFFTTTRGVVLGVTAGIITGIAVDQLTNVVSLKHPLGDYLLGLVAAPAAASIATLAAYGFFS